MIMTIIAIIMALLPFAALFLPLATFSVKIILLGETVTQLNIIEMIKMLTDESNELFTRYYESELFDDARPWLIAAVAALVLCVAAMLIGLALCCFKKKSLLAAASGAYSLSALSGIAWAICFPAFGKALEDNLLFSVNSALRWGSVALIVLLAVNAGLCWYRRTKES